jgi:hypothetical protein
MWLCWASRVPTLERGGSWAEELGLCIIATATVVMAERQHSFLNPHPEALTLIIYSRLWMKVEMGLYRTIKL